MENTVCNGDRLKLEALHVRIAEKSIVELTAMTIGEVFDLLDGLSLTGSRKLVADELLKEISARLGFLLNVGLEPYLITSSVEAFELSRCGYTGSLEPLRNSKVHSFSFDSRFPPKDLETLRDMPNLKHINGLAADAFWRSHDAKQAAQK